MPFKREAPLSTPLFGGPFSPSSMKFCYEILKALSCHLVETRGLYLNLVLKRYRVETDRRTDRRTDRITIANARYTRYANCRA